MQITQNQVLFLVTFTAVSVYTASQSLTIDPRSTSMVLVAMLVASFYVLRIPLQMILIYILLGVIVAMAHSLMASRGIVTFRKEDYYNVPMWLPIIATQGLLALYTILYYLNYMYMTDME